MYQELPQPAYDVELEDGEISSSSDVDEVYTPLQRPATRTATPAATASPLATCHQMQTALDDDEDDKSQVDSSSSTDSSSANLNIRTDESKRRKRVRRTVMVRVQPNAATADDVDTQKRAAARFKKFNIWTAALQEDAITENMRGCDVTHRGAADRSVENYDFSLGYRLNGLKRRLSNDSTDDHSGNEHRILKRRRPSTAMDSDGSGGAQRASVKSRLGHRSPSSARFQFHSGDRRDDGGGSGSGSEDASLHEPRHILDLEDPLGRPNVDIARDIANKLYEEKDELLVRIVEVLGTELPIEIYKETQRIEAGGGMMILNGKRRRTPGGIFLFLLKHHESLTKQDKDAIFTKERQIDSKMHKHKKSKSRDRKVEELKKRLCDQEKELPALNRKEHSMLGNNLSLKHQAANLSNPPPSPVGHEHSPEYRAHAINHVVPHHKSSTASSHEKASTSKSAAAAAATHDKDEPRVPDAAAAATNNNDCLEEDFLDLDNDPCDMDFF